jgi:hypothetical protein
MVNTTTARTLTTVQLFGACKDIRETIEIQELWVRRQPGACPKLGAYWDEMAVVLTELKRRGAL